MHGICHVDFNSKDGTLAEFYKGLFGWNLNTSMGEGYTLWQNGEDRIGGGFSTPQGGQPFSPGTCVYIQVEDIDATLGKISAGGGNVIVPKTQISPEHGFFALFNDPHGNTVGLWSES